MKKEKITCKEKEGRKREKGRIGGRERGRDKGETERGKQVWQYSIDCIKSLGSDSSHSRWVDIW